LYLNPTDTNEIHKILGKCKHKKSTGDDGISMTLLKQLCEDVCIPIAKLVNKSLQQGVVPDAMKLARVIPIYKAKSKQEFSNYRPISLLSNISKVLEKVIHKRMYAFLVKHDILYSNQFGFRPKHSTIDAIVTFTCDALRGIDNKASCLSVYLDLSKTFDTINHDILLKKLNHYGIRGVALRWFKSYLSQRTQYVSYKGVESEHYDISYGVPQGSVLGPLLFIIYSNDIPNAITHRKTVLFADDTTIYCIGKNLHQLQSQMNQDLGQLNNWFRANQLSVNASKTKYMLIGKQQSYEHKTLNLTLNDEDLERVQNTKFLGLYIDEHLQWDSHISHCIKKGIKWLICYERSQAHLVKGASKNIILHLNPSVLDIWDCSVGKFVQKIAL
jgi:hypothetical protein